MKNTEHNGLDIEQISPTKDSKYSPNLYLWLKKEKAAWAYRIYRDTHGTLWIGQLDRRELIGAKLVAVLCNGKRESTAAWQNIDAVEVPNFWTDYMANGRCAIDVDHNMWFIDDKSRWQGDGNARSCIWCGKTSQKLIRKTKTIDIEEWVNL